MKLLDRFRFARRAFQFSGAGPNISVGDLDRIIELSQIGEESASGIHVSETSGQRQATVFSCINIISGDAASLGVSLLERLPGGGSREVTDHAVARFLRRPNPAMSWKAFRVAGWQQYLSWGNEYSEIVYNGSDIEAWPLNPENVTVRVRAGAKTYEVQRRNGSKAVFGSDDIFHNFGYTFNGYWGVSPIRWCMETIGHALAVEQYGSVYFKSPSPRIVFKREGPLKDETALESLKKRWDDEFGGVRAQHRAAFLPPGISIDQVLKIPNNEAQFIEDRKFSKEEIAQIYRIPMHMLQALDRATFSNIEHQDLNYTKYCLRPHLTGFEQALENLLLTERERQTLKIRHNMNELLRGDFKTRMEGHQIAVAGGFRTPNEARALENEAPKDGGDELYMQLNMGPLSVLSQPPQSSEPTPRKVAISAEKRAAGASRKRMAQTYQPRILKAAKGSMAARNAEIRAKAEELIREGRIEQFLEWLATWSPEQIAALADEMLPVFAALAEAIAEAAAGEVDLDNPPDTQAFVREYARRFAEAFQSGTLAQLTQVASEAEGDALDAVLERLSEWETGGPSGTTRPEKVAHRESFQLMNAITALAFGAAGYGLVWTTFGKNCPYCNELDGRRVAGGGYFVPKGGLVNPGDGSEPMPSRGIKHPPLHGGCDCGITPG